MAAQPARTVATTASAARKYVLLIDKPPTTESRECPRAAAADGHAPPSARGSSSQNGRDYSVVDERVKPESAGDRSRNERCACEAGSARRSAAFVPRGVAVSVVSRPAEGVWVGLVERPAGRT